MRKTKIAILLLAVFFSATCVSQAARAEDVTPQADPDTVDLAAQDPADFTGVDASSVTALPDGGSAYNFTVDGTDIQILTPPSNFKPLKATDEQLIRYGFGPRPTDPAQLAQWTADMKAYKKTVKPKIFKKKKAQTSAAPVVTSTVYDHTTSFNWAGAVAKPARAGTYSGQLRHAYGYLDIPAKLDGSADTRESSWVGIGGYEDGQLLQCGTTMNAENGTAVYSFFWNELSGNSSRYIDGDRMYSNMKCIPGQRVKLMVDYSDANTGTVTYMFYVNTPTSQYPNGVSSGPITIKNRASCFDGGKSAEWIDERQSLTDPDGTQRYASLANFGKASWLNCYAATDISYPNFYTMGSYNCIPRDMTDSTGKLLAVPSMTGTYLFTDYWYAYGNGK